MLETLYLSLFRLNLLLEVQELIYFARNFKNEEEDKTDLEAFLYHASLQSDADKQKDGDLVQLMTIHASKGLEFPFVFIVGFEQGVFPSKRSLDVKSQLEEERRLAYVAITRGEKMVDFSFCERRYNDMSEPSMFLEELPFDILDFKSNSEYGHYGIGKKIMDHKMNNVNISDSEELKTRPVPSKKVKKYDIGDQISHKKFGKGYIINIYRKGDNLIAQVNFEFIGKKDLIIMKY